MDVDEMLRRYGLRPSEADLPAIRARLESLAAPERNWDEVDTEAMKLCCVQLFSAGHLDDVLPIWRAKESSFDAHCSIDVQLLCGAGLEETKAYLAAEGSDDASAALEYLRQCEATGDFERFRVEERMEWYSEYFCGDSADG